MKGESMKGIMSKMVLAATFSPICLSVMATPQDLAIKECREKVRTQNEQIANIKVDVQSARNQIQSLRDEKSTLAEKVKDLRADKGNLQDRVQRLKDDLQICEDRRGSSGQVETLRSENEILKREVARLNLKVEDLREQLQQQNGGGNSQQARTKIIQACTSISNVYYSNLCVSKSLEIEARPNVVSACIESINSEHYKIECIDTATKTGANAQQVRACGEIQGGDFWIVRCLSEN